MSQLQHWPRVYLVSQEDTHHQIKNLSDRMRKYRRKWQRNEPSVS